jgi:hypothetical protein
MVQLPRSRSHRLGTLALLALPLGALAQIPSSQVWLVSGGGQAIDPVAVSFATPYSYSPIPGDPTVVSVDPHYVADLRTRTFEMAAGISITRDCSRTACSARTMDLARFIITQPIKLTSPDRRPIQATATFSTLASMDMPLDAGIRSQVMLGILSGGFSPPPRTNLWGGCWVNSDRAASVGRCPDPVFERVPLNTAATRSVTVSVSSGSVMQLEVIGLLSLYLPASNTLSTYTGTMLLDPLFELRVPAGTLVESGVYPVTIVPEPGTMALWLAGLVLLAGRTARRSRR